MRQARLIICRTESVARATASVYTGSCRGFHNPATYMMSTQRPKHDARMPRTSRGRQTMEHLLHGAEQVFRERGFEGGSVSAICRYVGIAQGTFYLYFANKEEVYVRLVEQLEHHLISCLTQAISQASDPLARLQSAYDVLLDSITENLGLFQVFREAEFVRQDVPMRFYAAVSAVLVEVIESGIRGGSLRDIDAEVVAYGLLGAVLFLSLRYAVWGTGEIPQGVRQAGADLLLHGMAVDRGTVERRKETLPVSSLRGRAPLRAEEPEGGEATRRSLLASAERAFGEAGYHATTVSTITYLADVGQGTFYLYFPSKVAIFEELVREISREFRLRQSLAVAHCADRPAVEAEGLRSFLAWVREHPGAYRIVREAEFVDKGVGKLYYTRLADGYARGLAKAMDRGEIRRSDPEAFTYAILGIAHLCGQRWVLREDMERSADDILPHLVAWVLGGLHSPHLARG